MAARMGGSTSWRTRNGDKSAVTTRSFVGRAEQSRRAKVRNAELRELRRDAMRADFIAALTV